MSDLISRKAVIRLLAQEASHKAMQGFTDDARGLINAKEYVKGLPTAFSVDEVVERLEERMNSCGNGAFDKCIKMGYEQSIQVVKEGAVKDE